jgi:hypothetical protein
VKRPGCGVDHPPPSCMPRLVQSRAVPSVLSCVFMKCYGKNFIFTLPILQELQYNLLGCDTV